jgi:Domain of unknown function (DUF4412)
MVITADAAKAMMGAVMTQQAGTLSANPAAPVATGKKDKINGYDAEEYTYTNGNLKASYWISANYPDAKAVVSALAQMEKSSLASMLKGLTPDLTSFNGVPVKTEVVINGQKITTTLISATEQAVDPSQYQVPAGYTEVKMPSMPSMPPPDAPQPPAAAQ